jgi:hypothetical protein
MVPAPPALVLGRLADERRLRALAAVALGARRVGDVADRAGLSSDEAARALAQLSGVGIVVSGDQGLEIDHGTLARAARAASTPRPRPDLSDATPEQAVVLRNFVDGDGRIRALPARAGKRRLVLEYVAGRFDPRCEYREQEVNDVLVRLHDDHASLRRLLVDEGFLTRDAGIYRRVPPVSSD